MKIFLFISLLLLPLTALGAPISVSVVDEAGAPIAGATVQVQRYDGALPETVVSTTDAAGAAQFELGAASGSPKFFGRVAAWKTGRAVAGTNLIGPSATLTLAPEAQVSGLIEDENGPAQGVTVALQSIRDQSKFLFLMPDSPLAEKLSARTDAQGQFVLRGVPAETQLSLQISGERYATQHIAAQSGGVVSAKMRPGAGLRGQVVDVAGAPLAGLRVFAQGQDRGGEGWAQAATGADGTYDLSGLTIGKYNVIFDTAPDAGYAIAAREGVYAAAGETREVETARAVEGVVVRGRVIDAATKAGIENISVGVYGPARPNSGAAVESFRTDAQGDFAARVVPGANKFYVMGVPQQYIRTEKDYNLNITENAKTPAPVFELTPAIEVRGRVVDEAGQGVKMNLELRRNYEEWPFESDENGDFTAYGPAEGEVTVARPRWGGEDEPWEIVKAPTVKVPAKTPLRVVVRPAVFGVLTGRAQDGDGAPLMGVKVDLTVSSGKGDGMTSQYQTVFSDAQGRIELPKLRSDQTVSLRGVEKSGYDRDTNEDAGGELKRAGNDWSLGTLTLRQRVGQIAGRVRLKGGAPAAGARVFAAGSETIADAQGNFELKSLPLGAVNVIAYAAEQFGWQSGDAAANAGAAALTVNLAPQTLQPTDRELAGEMIARAKVLATTTNYWATRHLKLSAPEDTTRALEELIAKPNAEGLAQMIYVRGADADVPLELLMRAVRAIDKPNWRLYAATMLFAKRADWPDDAPTRAFVASLAADAGAVEATSDENRWTGAIGLVGIAPILERFEGQEAGDKAFTRAVQWIWKEMPAKGNVNAPDRLESLAVVAELVAANSPHLYRRFFDYITPESPSYGRALQEGAVALARSRGLEAAAPYLRDLLEAPTPQPDENGNVSAVRYLAVQATREAVAAGGRNAPALALELARAAVRLGDGAPDEAERALAEAAFFQPPDVAAQLWRETVPAMSAERAAQLAVRIIEVDAELGDELLKDALEKLEESPAERGPWERSDVPAFAFYERQVDAARARYRLEKQWQQSLAQPNNQQEFADLVRAMAAIDGERAFEWASLIPESNGDDPRDARIDALRKAAQYLEAGETLRARVDFERWGRGDTVFVD